MSIRTWGATNPTAGGSYGVGERFLMDPDAYASLEQRKKEFDVTSGQQAGRDAFKMDAFNKLFGLAGNMAGQFGQVGGAQKPQPSITRGPLYSDQQIQGQVNQGVAANDARYQTLMRQLGSSAAGRGLGMSSPAIQSELTRLGIANIGDNARAARQIPMQYVQANADSTFRTDQLAQQQWREGEDDDIRRRQMQLQSLNQLMSQLGGYL